jgi:hypothetical protein
MGDRCGTLVGVLSVEAISKGKSKNERECAEHKQLPLGIRPFDREWVELAVVDRTVDLFVIFGRI